MSKRTPEEIAAEIAALEALQPPPGRFQSKQRDNIELMVSTLKGQIDETADEFNEMSDEDIDTYYGTRGWVNGQNNDRPSESWKGQW